MKWAWLLMMSALAAFCVVLSAQTSVPMQRIWDDASLADWATPIAALNVRPAHYSSAEYYHVAADNLRTYPVYHPDSEPLGYWEDLQKKKLEPLVDAALVRTPDDWIQAGERAFREADNPWARTKDAALIARARDPRSFDGVLKLADGTAFGPRWVVTQDGVMLTFPACGGCHFTIRPDRTVAFAGPGGNGLRAGLPPLQPRGVGGQQATQLFLRRFYAGDPDAMIQWRQSTVPWAPDERLERRRTFTDQERAANPLGEPFQGTSNRTHGSPFYTTKIPDLHTLRYSRYIDATATHRLRGPEDVARYAAFVTGTDPMDFGPHRILSDEQRRVRIRYADEVLYAIGMYLMSLEPPKNPNPAPSYMLKRGEEIFRREGCVNCHVPPNYTSGKLTLAQGWQPPSDHPYRDDIVPISVATDPGLSLKTRKGTGFYKIPSLRGVWYRPLLLHDGSLTSLEEMFDPARLNPDYAPNGWNPPGVTTRAVPGHTFGLTLNPDDKQALLAFLRSL
jgi:hypothetical protein